MPLYPTLTPEQIGYMLRDSGAKVAVLSSGEQYEKLTQAGGVAGAGACGGDERRGVQRGRRVLLR